MKKTLVSLVLTALCLTGCQLLGGKRDETIDVGPLQREYKKSKEETRAKYNGKDATILGAVLSAQVLGDTAHIRVGSQTDSELIGAESVKCVVDKQDLGTVSDVKEKQAIRVKGILFVDESGMELKSCKRIPLTDN
jgi:hypothetical protein